MIAYRVIIAPVFIALVRFASKVHFWFCSQRRLTYDLHQAMPSEKPACCLIDCDKLLHVSSLAVAVGPHVQNAKSLKATSQNLMERNEPLRSWKRMMQRNPWHKFDRSILHFGDTPMRKIRVGTTASVCILGFLALGHPERLCCPPTSRSERHGVWVVSGEYSVAIQAKLHCCSCRQCTSSKVVARQGGRRSALGNGRAACIHHMYRLRRLH
eukprot:6477970-Amphidinium_carterae.2